MSAANRWTDVANNPNAPEAVAHRAAVVRAATAQALIESRTEYLGGLANGKDVLDVGFVGHMAESANDDSWLHARLRRSAKSCLGVDILEPEVARLRELGYDALCADLAAAPLDRTFDLIVCGEVFEHLPSPHSMLLNLSRMLRAGGRIVVTVPNPWYVNVVLKSVVGRRAYIDNVDHVCWFDPATMAELAERAGLKLVAYAGIRERDSGTLKSRLLFSAQPLLCAAGVNPLAFAKTMLYELVEP